MAGEGPVGALDEDPGARAQMGQGAALVTQPLDGHPDVGGPGQGRQGVRVGVPPQLPGQEAPLEELAPGDGEVGDPPARADHRHHPGGLLDDGRHPELVPQAAHQREEDPEHDHRPGRGRPDHDPDGPGQRVADEGHAGHDLVGEGQGQGQVEVEVDHPPRLVLQAAAGDPDGGHAAHDQQPEGDGGGQDVRVGRQELPELVECSRSGQLGVAQGHQHDVQADEPERPGGDPTVPLHQPVLAHRPLEPREPGHQHHHEQHQIGAGEAGQASAGDEPSARGGERPPALPGDDQCQDHAHAEAGHRQEGVAECPPGDVARTAPAARPRHPRPRRPGGGDLVPGGCHPSKLPWRP